MEDVQERVKEVTKELNLANSPELCCLDFCSEAGEVAKEVLELTDYGKKAPVFNPDLARELGDAFYSLISLANLYNINLKEQLERSLEKYKKREERRNSSSTKVKLEPTVLAKNFLCLNAVAGCRNDCVYCYKHGWDFENKFCPKKFCEPSEILKKLKSHRYFHKNIPLAIHNSATDPFQKDVTEITFELLDGLEEMGITNIVGLITKEYLSEEMITRLESYKNIRPIIFVTFSFLPQNYEFVLDDRRLQTMKNLSKSGLKRVLYYRPIIKGVNDTKEIAEKIVELGEKYFNCVVRSSLKVDVNIIENMAKKGIYIDSSYDIGLNIHDSLKKMFPDMRSRIDRVLSKAKIPYFKKTSCAISWLFNEPDYNSQWIREKHYCSKLCPLNQRRLCSKQSVNVPKMREVEKLIKHLGIKINYEIKEDCIVVEGQNIFYSDIKYLRMALRFPVLILINEETLTAEEYDTKYVNMDRIEIRKLIKKKGIVNYSL